MADVGNVMFLGLRMQNIEKELKEATLIHKALELVDNHWLDLEDDMEDDFKEAFSEMAIRKEIEMESLERKLQKATQDWQEASEEYNKEHKA